MRPLAPSPLALLLISLGPAAAQQPTAPPAGQQTSVVDTVHNLSVSGPGQFKASQETRICIFCHTPHRARSTAPLWNRNDSRETYLSYSSSTFQGLALQPTGGSKLCLSCHDGSIALGSIQSEPTEIQMVPGRRFLTSGSGFLGTNLTDDHPISFDYAASKGGTGIEYRPPGTIVAPVHIDDGGFVQCTSCHEPHNNQFGKFLLTTDLNSQLCLACHVPTGWPAASHATSGATWTGAGTNPWPTAPYATVAENACANCHVSHGASHSQRLLVFQAEEDNCLNCHSGEVASQDISADLSKPSAHSPFGTVGTHDPAEDFLSMPRHSECQDCHQAHAVQPGSVAAPGVPGPLLGASGLNGSGQPTAPISFGFEVCYKCHADQNGGQAYVPRILQQVNTRLEFDPGNPSFHPVEAAGTNPDVPSLLPPWTEASRLACTDCHQSDSSPAAGGTGPAGPHGSVFRPLLVANYETADFTNESPSAYALCYRCHSRTSILNGDSFKEHDKHVMEERVACAACHDAHGISSSQGTSLNNTHLINFDSSIVSPSSKNGRLEFVDEGFRKGNCSLTCHGEDHDRENY